MVPVRRSVAGVAVRGAAIPAGDLRRRARLRLSRSRRARPGRTAFAATIGWRAGRLPAADPVYRRGARRDRPGRGRRTVAAAGLRPDADDGSADTLSPQLSGLRRYADRADLSGAVLRDPRLRRDLGAV